MPSDLHTACIGLGANTGEAIETLLWARQQLSLKPCQLIHSSSLYRSAPMGPQDQDDFYNAVVVIQTGLPPSELLAHLKSLEQAAGRQQRYRWGPRELDLDILLFDDMHLKTNSLQIPHPGLYERSFVLIPLQEIASAHTIPWKEALEQNQAHGNTAVGDVAIERISNANWSA